jgi:hypothetical protein
MQNEIPGVVMEAESVLWKLIFSVIQDQTHALAGTQHSSWNQLQSQVQSQALTGLGFLVNQYQRAMTETTKPVLVIREQAPALPPWPPVPVEDVSEESAWAPFVINRIVGGHARRGRS